MRYLSLFSGIEAASQAWHPMGWDCAAVAEILEYQSAVIAKNHPTVKNLGDVTKITEDDIKALGHIDVVIFGSPCQDMSVAGKRQGLETVKEDTNHSSILFFDGMRVFRYAQEHCGARFLVWENVPGALSSNGGKDFGTILNEMVGIECSSDRPIWRSEGVAFGRDSMCEWSVLDAQWFGVAQRRRRLFVVLDTGDWKNRRPILLEPESMRGDTPPSRQAGKGSTAKIEGRSGISSGEVELFSGHGKECEVSSTLLGREGGFDLESENRVVEKICYDMQALGEYGDKNVASTLKGRDYKDATDLIVEDRYTCAIVSNIIGRNPETRSGGNGTGYNEDVMYTLTGNDHHAIAYSLDSLSSNSMKSSNPHSGCNEVEVSKTIDTSGINPACNQGGIAIVSPKCFQQNVRDEVRYIGGDGEIAGALMANSGAKQTNYIHHGYSVRRLTPRECERLQGFPDDYTKLDDTTAFSKRINALGRSMAVPVIQWIGKQIETCND